MKAEIFRSWGGWYINFYNSDGEYIKGSSEHADTLALAVDRARFYGCQNISIEIFG